MFFWIKKSKIVIDCLTSSQAAIEFNPIVKSSSVVPDWWKSLQSKNMDPSKDMVPRPTMKTCSGFIEFFRASFTIPMWSDLTIAVSPEGSNSWRYQFSDLESIVSYHDEEQHNSWISYDKIQQLKIASPWWLKTKEPVRCLMVHPMWNLNVPSDYEVLPGILNFATSHATHTNIIIKRSNENKMVSFKAGDPLVHLFPLTEKKFEIKTHLVDKKELDKLQLTYTSFIGSHIKQSRVKCPFH